MNLNSVPSSSTRKSPDLDYIVVLDVHFIVYIELHALYANKKTLHKHLMLFAINSIFMFKTKYSDITSMHVVYLVEHCIGMFGL